MIGDSTVSGSLGTCAGCGRDVVDQGVYVGADLYHPTCVHLTSESATVQELRAALLTWRDRYARLEERVDGEKADEILKRRNYRNAVLESVGRAVEQLGQAEARSCGPAVAVADVAKLIEKMRGEP